jgi:DNA-binding response OmpR family regulator
VWKRIAAHFGEKVAKAPRKAAMTEAGRALAIERFLAGHVGVDDFMGSTVLELVNGNKVSMPLKEFELLELLLENVNRVLTRGQIIDRVWGSNYFGDTKTLDVHIKRIRSKIEDDPARPVHLMTVRGLGYKFEV